MAFGRLTSRFKSPSISAPLSSSSEYAYTPLITGTSGPAVHSRDSNPPRHSLPRKASMIRMGRWSQSRHTHSRHRSRGTDCSASDVDDALDTDDDDDAASISSESSFGDWGYASWDKDGYDAAHSFREPQQTYAREPSYRREPSYTSAYTAPRYDSPVTYSPATPPRSVPRSTRPVAGTAARVPEKEALNNIIFRALPPPPPPPPRPMRARKTSTSTPTATSSKPTLKIQHVDHIKAKRAASRPSPIRSPVRSNVRNAIFVPKEYNYNSYTPVMRGEGRYANPGYLDVEDTYRYDSAGDLGGVDLDLDNMLESPTVPAAALCERYGHILEQTAPREKRYLDLDFRGRVVGRKCTRCRRHVKV